MQGTMYDRLVHIYDHLVHIRSGFEVFEGDLFLGGVVIPNWDSPNVGTMATFKQIGVVPLGGNLNPQPFVDEALSDPHFAGQDLVACITLNYVGIYVRHITRNIPLNGSK